MRGIVTGLIVGGITVAVLLVLLSLISRLISSHKWWISVIGQVLSAIVIGGAVSFVAIAYHYF